MDDSPSNVSRVFISYSWTSPQHEARIVELATELRESGVDAILDKWDLKEGHDAYAFMERMVADISIRKVVIFCDRAYAERTNARKGGVGAEAQIISGEIYKKSEQDKFAVVSLEKDESDIPYVPAYYKSRIYIDFTDPSSYSENFERLLRWIFDQPFHVKPNLGQPPAYLLESREKAQIATSSAYRRALEAVRSNKDSSIPFTQGYIQALISGFEVLRIDASKDPIDDQVLESIQKFQPYRGEFLNIMANIALYNNDSRSPNMIHRFFEAIIPYLDRPRNVNQWREWDFDNYRIIIHDLFLFTFSIFLRYERFDIASRLLNQYYYCGDSTESPEGGMAPFEVFSRPLQSLHLRNQRLKLGRLSLRADMIRQDVTGTPIDFQHVMQGDFVLFLYNQLHRRNERWYWWPHSLVFSDRHSGPFEIFSRSQSSAYFRNILNVLSIKSKDDIGNLLAEFSGHSRKLPQWEFSTINPWGLMAFDALGTRP